MTTRAIDVQKWLLRADHPLAEVRKEAYSSAIKKITANAYWAPLHTYVTTYGHSKQLDFTVSGRAAALLSGEVEMGRQT
jgi:peptide/nickel transport system substrate-binding protein